MRLKNVLITEGCLIELAKRVLSLIGARIRECRKEMGYSQRSEIKELAKKQIALLVQIGDN